MATRTRRQSYPLQCLLSKERRWQSKQAGRAKRSVASLGGLASHEALLHTLAKEYCCKEVAQMALFQCT